MVITILIIIIVFVVFGIVAARNRPAKWEGKIVSATVFNFVLSSEEIFALAYHFDKRHNISRFYVNGERIEGDDDENH